MHKLRALLVVSSVALLLTSGSSLYSVFYSKKAGAPAGNASYAGYELPSALIYGITIRDNATQEGVFIPGTQLGAVDFHALSVTDMTTARITVEARYSVADFLWSIVGVITGLCLLIMALIMWGWQVSIKR